MKEKGSHLHEGVGIAGSPKVGQPHRSVPIPASLLHHLICNTRAWQRRRDAYSAQQSDG